MQCPSPDLETALTSTRLFDHRGVDDEDGRILNQPGPSAFQIAGQDFRLDQLLPAPELIGTEKKKRHQHCDHPELGRGPQLLFFFPAEKLARDKYRQTAGKEEGADRLPILA